MKKIGLALLALVCTFCLFYAVVMLSPRERNAAVVASAYQSTNQRLDAMLADSLDVEKNGFLNPTLVPYWGRKSVEAKRGLPAENSIQAWGEFSTPFMGELIEHQALQKQNDEKYLTALRGMEGVAPELRKAMNATVFIPPGFELHVDSEVPNYIAARACAQTMVGLAEAEVAQGEAEQAAQDLASVIHFGSLFRGQGTLINDMIGIAIQAIGLDATNGLIDPQSKLSSPTWKSLAQKLLDAAPAKDTIVHSLEGEITFCHNSLKNVANNPGMFEGAAPLFVLPGFLEREERIYNNLMSDLVLQARIRKKTLSIPHSLTDPEATDWVTGRTGLIAQLFVPNCERAASQIDLLQKSMTASATFMGIAAYRAQEGKLPESLESVAQAGIPFTEDAELVAAMKYEVKGDSATLEVPVGKPGEEVWPAVGREWKPSWLEQDGEVIRYTFEKQPAE